MASVESFLWDLVQNVAPSPSRVLRAQRSHDRLRKLLGEGRFKSWLRGSYLIGSYSRDTAIHPLDDVDILFLIDVSPWQSGLQKFFEAKPDPEAVLNTFAVAIRRRYELSSVRTQRRSVRLKLAHLNIDVVPAIRHSNENLVWVPDRDLGEWIRSGPNAHRMHGEEVNRRNGGKYKPLVKLLKYWNSNLASTARLKSFTIETMSARIFERYRFSRLEEGFFKYLDFLMWLDGRDARQSWSNPCGITFAGDGMTVPDIAETGSNVAARVDGERRIRFVEAARASRTRLLEAFDAPTPAGAATKLKAALRV